MSSKILFILLIVGLISVKVTNAQIELLNALGALFAGLAESLKNDSGVLAALAPLISTLLSNPNDTNAINAQMAALQQAIAKSANCGILKDGQQYYIQNVNGSFKGGYIQTSNNAEDWQRGATLTNRLDRASKFTVVQKSCNVYGLCVRGLCMSRCEGGCDTGTGQYQTVTFHVTDTTGSYSQWTVSAVDGVVGAYYLQSDIAQYLDYIRKHNGAAIISLNATLLPESQFKFIEVKPCTPMLVNGQEYYLKTNTGDYVVVKGVLGYLEQIEQAGATKFRAFQLDCDVYGFCITGANGERDKCMSRCQNCVSETMDYQSVQWHVSDSNRPYSQWKFFNKTQLYAEGVNFGYVYFNKTSSGAKQLVLDLNNRLQFEFIKVA